MFPWMVRITGGCSGIGCAGTLITSKHVLTSYYCAVKSGEKKPCDHSDGKRIAILGQNERLGGSRSEGTKIPIIGVKSPKMPVLVSAVGASKIMALPCTSL